MNANENTPESVSTNKAVFASALANAVGSVPSGYEAKLNSATEAAVSTHEELVKENGYNLYDLLLGEAHRVGYGSQARSILSAVGLTERPAPPAPVVEDEDESSEGAEKSGTKNERISALEGQVAALVDAVADLKRLAQQHLGA